MHPEKKYEFFNFLKFKLDYILFNYYYNTGNFFSNPDDYQKIATSAICDVLEYYKIDLETFRKCSDIWPKYESELWNCSNDPVEFYKKWNNKYSLSNTCANITNQLSIDHQRIVSYYFSKKGVYVDFGCGTATLSIGLKVNNRINGELILLDIPNDIQNFVKYRINKHNLNNMVKWEDILNFKEKNITDGLICIDVLEHIENSTEVFIDTIAPMIKKGGLLIMRAPWRGQLTHIDSAADNFYDCGGRQFLSHHFKTVMRFGSNDITCVYKKR